ncbi:hypothetical protein AMECASPLE_019719 [Ameca splendens]|uniref:Uncharacterized protein n=1 Tax=Ameca splendens TaxID=208324 RepID=A0ABV0XG80_9TELE
MTSKQNDALRPSGAVCAPLRTNTSRNSPKQAPSAPETIFIISVMLSVLIQPASAHPQCLDFEPPFKPQWHLEFCSQYEEFGCCDQRADNVIAERYWDIIEELETAGKELCEDMLKEIMCQERLVKLSAEVRLTHVGEWAGSFADVC